MKLKFINPKRDKVKLYRLVIREAISLLVLNGIFNTEQAARYNLMKEAKKIYK